MSAAALQAGQRYGRLTIVGTEGARRVTVACDCGTTKTIHDYNVSSGRTRSCGCLRREMSAAKIHTLDNTGATTHGKTRTPTWNSWCNMRKRCSEHATNPQTRRDYFDRGIRVCERWLVFANFLADMGERPVGKTLDRINNDGNYVPGNCRWATATEQASNQRPRRLAPKGGA